MGLKAAVIGSAFAALARTAAAAQPGAAEPVPAPMRDLVWGRLNFLHTTDTHGWHAGHLQEPQYSADWGDYVSFAHHMREKADRDGVDLLLVDTGDRVEGNGLYDASSPKGEYYYDIYRQQDVDIICSGNHELYIASTADGEHRYTVPNFKENYIASNLDYIDPESGEKTPLAQRYRKFQTKNQKLDVVAFGFLFDFTGNANNTVVQPVRETVREPWFQTAIREETDVFVVIGHVGVQMLEFKIIFRAIRKANPLTPILFFGGHVHIRDATTYDARSFAVASGRYFETIGWMSIDGELERKALSTDTNFSFTRRYIDNNLLGLHYHTGLDANTFPTEHGRNVSAMITSARSALDLDYAFGCAPQTFWLSRAPYPGDDSIFTWLEKDVLPDIAVNPARADVPRLVIFNTGAIRFDIFQGPFTRDATFIVSPFLSKMVYIPDVPYAVARKVIGLLNNAGKIVAESGSESGSGPSFPRDPRFMANPEQLVIHESVIHELPVSNAANGGPLLDTDFQQKPLGDDGAKPTGQRPRLTEGYTTHDDIGRDGDDTVHQPVNFYVVPNCVQAEVGLPPAVEGKENQGGDFPEKVDLVFLDFITPLVLVALKFAGGGDYTEGDVKLYVEGTFTELMAGWIEENWPKTC
ncbi:Metallo-dependent phosphatase-like protein [Dichotomopilus funicola]|uniref:Metallo-dependent phosphatase-like protein n=1 Tax=Dichotomopilus funicola TaxID=1934379 RepID=A0AAN6V7D4_9PEZI|nr:Metallo-dependent phosphatase-like protein [Dichotomopilus funicola]